MSLSYHIKQQVVQVIFFQIRSHFPENGKTGFFCFLRVREAVSILKMSFYFYVEAAWLTVLTYCALCRTE